MSQRIGSKRLMTFTWLLLRAPFAVLFLFATALQFGGVAGAQNLSKPPLSMMQDAQVIQELASDRSAADAAVSEIVRRGVRMVPLLVKMKGDRRFFRGFLGSSESTQVLVPTGDPRKDRWALKEGKFLTMEVAALYLITAIYHNSIDFAQSPYLENLLLPELDRPEGNTKKLVARAWKATIDWYRRLMVSDIATLRAADGYPLKAADVEFR